MAAGILDPFLAYAVLILTLSIFALLAILPINSFFARKKSVTSSDDSSNRISFKSGASSYFSCKGQVGWLALSLTTFASAIGNWILFYPADIGANYSWVGVLGQAIGSSLPRFIFLWVAPKLRAGSNPDEFTGTDFVLRRYGFLPYLVMSFVSLFFMVFALTAELTTVTTTMQMLTNNGANSLVCTLLVTIATLGYTSYSGLKASIFTDQFQAIFILLFSIIFIVAATTVLPQNEQPNWSSFEFAPKNSWMAASVLILSVYPCELLNQGNWQRVFAAKSLKDLNISLIVSGILISFVVFIFGVGGIFSSNLSGSEDSGMASGYLLIVMTYLPQAWLCVVLALSVSLACSSIDTIQSALGVLFAHLFETRGLKTKWAILATILINLPVVFMASLHLNLYKIYLMSNLLCVIVVVPNFMALHWVCTKWGILAGLLAGILTLLGVGWVTFGDFVSGITFLYPSDISNLAYLLSFILVPVISMVVLVVVSLLERLAKNKWNLTTRSSVILPVIDNCAAISEDAVC